MAITVRVVRPFRGGRLAGLDAAEIADLRQGTVPPAGLSEREQSAYQFALRLTRDRRVDEALFLTAERALGTGALTDIVLLAGRYHVTWAVLNAFEIPAPRDKSLKSTT